MIPMKVIRHCAFVSDYISYVQYFCTDSSTYIELHSYTLYPTFILLQTYIFLKRFLCPSSLENELSIYNHQGDLSQKFAFSDGLTYDFINILFGIKHSFYLFSTDVLCTS
jgi:hypothetical protein